MSSYKDKRLAACFDALAPEPLPGDWGDVLDRAEAAHRDRTPRFTRWRIAALAAVILVGALVVTGFGIGDRLLDLIEGAAPAPPEVKTPVWSPDGRRVAFSSRRSGNWDLYVANADGSGQRNLTRNPAFDSLPVWSPDGRKIAFVRHHEGSDGIWVMNADGSGQRRLVRRGDLPAWSPDGRKIVFSSGAQGIFVMNADGSDHRRLAPRLAAGRGSFVWSPDWRKLAILSDAGRGDFNFGLYMVNADGSGLRSLAQGLLAGRRPGRGASQPAWSPDGRKIAFVADRDGGDDVFVVNVDGSGLRKLTRSPADDGAPVWSPDGRKIAFVSNRSGTYGVYVMKIDGSGQRALAARTVAYRGLFFNGRMARLAAAEVAPAWSPDGRKIAFVSDRDGTYEVYVMNADGSGQRRLRRLAP
jgi:Tol biopolymer transport system component